MAYFQMSYANWWVLSKGSCIIIIIIIIIILIIIIYLICRALYRQKSQSATEFKREKNKIKGVVETYNA